MTSSRISRILNAHIEAMNKRSSGCPREKEENCRSVQDNPPHPRSTLGSYPSGRLIRDKDARVDDAGHRQQGW